MSNGGIDPLALPASVDVKLLPVPVLEFERDRFGDSELLEGHDEEDPAALPRDDAQDAEQSLGGHRLGRILDLLDHWELGDVQLPVLVFGGRSQECSEGD